MTDSFEIQKNTKALSYTALICALLLAIAFLYKWRLQIPPMPAIQDLIEINLGNEKEGMGNIQPLVKGDPAPDVPEPQSIKSAAVNDEPSRDIQADEEDDKEAAPVTKPIKPNNEAKNLAKETVTKPVKTNNPVPVVNPNPAPPKPKMALYKGGNGTGGNGAAQDNGYKNQGYKAGSGDNGSPAGNPDSYGNTPVGKSGVSVIRGLSGRRPIRFPSMEDDFNENAKVYIDIKVDASGAVINASIAKGTTTSNSLLKNIALQKARQLRFPSSQNDEESGTILFNFILKN
jgi:outer membrane biosynthesis protein TonB